MSEVIKEPKFENSSWNFELDQTNLFAFWRNSLVTWVTGKQFK
jgi:hypothetical protein